MMRALKILEGDFSMTEEEREEQINKIISRLPTLSDNHILDIADNIFWDAKKFYNPTKEVVVSADKVKRIMKLHPELLI